MQSCPCCGQEVQDSSLPSWRKPTRVVSFRNKSIRLSHFRASIFDAVWEATQQGRSATTTEVVEAAYANDVHGGPEDAEASVAVTMTKLRIQLRSIGLTIPARSFFVMPWNGSEEQMEEQALRVKKFDGYDEAAYQRRAAAKAMGYRPKPM